MRGLALALASLLGCGTDDTGRLHADWIEVKGCRDGQDQRFEPYELDGKFFGVENREGVAFLRMQQSGRRLGAADALVIEIDDLGYAQAHLGVAQALDGVTTRATVSLYGSCPDTRQSVVAAGGTVTFHSLDLDADGHVAGDIAFEDLLDLRTGQAVGKHFTGSFDFHVIASPPHQGFANSIH